MTLSTGNESSHTKAGAIATAGGAALFVLLRVLAIADWNWHTAFAIAHTVNFDHAVGIVLGTLMANEILTGVLLIWLLPLSLIHAAWPLDHGERTAGGILLAATMVAASIALVSTSHSWWVFVGAAVVAVSFLAARRFLHYGRVHDAVRFLLERVGPTALLGALVLAAVVRIPWVPLERIETDSGTLTGYVMASDPGFLKVLTEDERHLLILVDDTVSERVELGAH